MPKRPKPAPAFTLRPGESISFVLPVVPRTKKNSRKCDQERDAQVSHTIRDASRPRIEVTLRALTKEELERKPEPADERCPTCGRSDGE